MTNHGFDLGQLGLQDARRKDEHSRDGVSYSEKHPILIHYHIFKNAGTSFEWALEQSFGNRFMRYDKEIPWATISAEECVGFLSSAPESLALSSHQLMLPPPQVRGRRVYTSILIRDPIARIRSIYSFERRQEVPSPGAIKAKELDFKGYVEWRLAATPAMLCNYQAHFCARTKAGSDGSVKNPEHRLQRAVGNLDQIDIVGTVERYDAWLALAQSILIRAFPNILLVSTRQNVTNAQATEDRQVAILDDLVNDLGRPLAEQLVRNNELDMRLHQVAEALLARRLAEHGVDVALINAYANAHQRLPVTQSDSGDARV
jgi:hypothetical protein